MPSALQLLHQLLVYLQTVIHTNCELHFSSCADVAATPFVPILCLQKFSARCCGPTIRRQHSISNKTLTISIFSASLFVNASGALSTSSARNTIPLALAMCFAALLMTVFAKLAHHSGAKPIACSSALLA